jgi:hypothetical protein
MTVKDDPMGTFVPGRTKFSHSNLAPGFKDFLAIGGTSFNDLQQPLPRIAASPDISHYQLATGHLMRETDRVA